MQTSEKYNRVAQALSQRRLLETQAYETIKELNEEIENLEYKNACLIEVQGRLLNVKEGKSSSGRICKALHGLF